MYSSRSFLERPYSLASVVLPKPDFPYITQKNGLFPRIWSILSKPILVFSIKYPDLVIEGKMKVIPIGGLYRKELFGRLNLI